MNDELFTLLVIDGEVVDINNSSTSVVRFDGLTRAEALDLTERSMKQGYCVAGWIEPEGDAECGKKA